MKNLDTLVKTVWAQPTLPAKKEAALYLVSVMEHQKQATKLTLAVNKAKTPAQVDYLVSNISLSGEGMGVL